MDSSKFLGAYLKSSDIQQPVAVVIRDCLLEKLQDEECLVMYFQGQTKGLVMNSTNIRFCQEQFGSKETNDWSGRPVILAVDHNIPFGSKIVSGLRLRPAAAAEFTPTAPPVGQPVSDNTGW